jgi:hypothetical protein
MKGECGVFAYPEPNLTGESLSGEKNIIGWFDGFRLSEFRRRTEKIDLSWRCLDWRGGGD